MKRRKHDNSKNDGHEIVAHFLRFQSTGQGFDTAWEGVGPLVEQCARLALHKLRVKVWTGWGEWAAADVSSMTKVRLYELGKPGATGHFDPRRTKASGVSGLKGWLYRVTFNQAVDWARDNCNVGDKKIFVASDLEWNEPSDEGVTGLVFEKLPAKMYRADLLPILEEAIGHLTDPLMRKAVILKLDGLSEAVTGERLGVSDTTIHRRLHDAYAILKPLLEARGVDAGWLAA